MCNFCDDTADPALEFFAARELARDNSLEHLRAGLRICQEVLVAENPKQHSRWHWIDRHAELFKRMRTILEENHEH